ncbi:MAG: glycerophosphodiester phosphodiesterase [Chloroflexota bacterium]
MVSKTLRAILGAIVVLMSVYFFFVWLSSPVEATPFFSQVTTDRPWVIAHQGGDGLRPSNTLIAFQHAVDLGADVLEMDIHSSGDGVLVVIHDDTVDRTTNGSGPVQAFTFEALQALDAGYHWPTLAEESHREDRPYRGQGITIPGLEEIFIAFPEMPMNIEIKQKEPSITQSFCDLIFEYGMQEQVLVASFHRETITEFREVCPGIPTSGVEHEIRNFFILNTLLLGRAYQSSANAFQVPEKFGSLQVINPRFVRNAQHHNVDVHVWTVNSEAQMRAMLAAGVDGIITDYPDQLIKVIEE